MITPIFRIEQSSTHIILKITCKYVKASDLDYTIEKNAFIFHCNPYFLNLIFTKDMSILPTEIVSFDVDSSIFSFSIEKAQIDEYFPDLNMVTAFLCPKDGGNKLNEPKIEIIATIDDGKNIDIYRQPFCELFADVKEVLLETLECKYGFMGRHHDIHITHKQDFIDLFVNPRCFTLPNSKRLLIIEKIEDNQFEPEHYIADLFDDSEVQRLISFSNDLSAFQSFSDSDSTILVNLSNREYLMDPQNVLSSLVGLVDILLSYAYDRRITEGEHNIESAWNIVALSSTLSHNRLFYTLDECFSSFIRRSLCYPLYRNYQLSINIVNDVKSIMKSGKIVIVKCFLDIYSPSERYYLINEMFIKDYLVWLQQIPEDCQLYSSFIQQVKTGKY
ncbi:hypothetical protein MXB_3512 [Myxobolus squamalis]|nr:hypothetical protein MXB_3512 [Myxobolus squamalis]